MNSAQDAVLSQIEDGIMTITLHRPESGNAWNSAMTKGFFAAFERAAQSADVRVIILTGAGSAFCVGGDGAALDAAVAEGEAKSSVSKPFWEPLRIGKPVIAAIPGACFGVGLQQALYCDLRFASSEAKFSTAYTRRGLVAEFGTSWLLPRLIGTGNAMDLLLSARLVRAPEALAMGLINRVFPAGELLAETRLYARQLVQLCSPSSMMAVKRQLYQDLMGDLFGAYERAGRMLEQAVQSSDFKEGVKSWLEKRAPRFAPLYGDDAFIDL